MTQTNEQLFRLIEKMDDLMKRQERFSAEIGRLSADIDQLKNQIVSDESFDHPIEMSNGAQSGIPPVNELDEVVSFHRQPTGLPNDEQLISYSSQPRESHTPKSDLERFIGENLINKIGIAITVIGVAIGAKYSIDHDLISPLTRIILGYLMGVALLGIGIRLKQKYINYSAVLVSGSIAILYFITFFAYTLYGLFPQVVAFLLMVVFTGLGVAAAINYNRQVIAHIGLVGAYAVPLLLSNESGNVTILFSYIAIINIGILIISFLKYWKPILYTSFFFSWFIYFSWYSENYRPAEHFGIALIFLSVFFITFYIIFLSYKLLQEEKFNFDDVLLILANSFVFYGIGYSLLNTNDTGAHLLGVFTLCNASVNLIVSFIVYRQKQADMSLFYLITGLVLVFTTITFPVQLNGNWVTLLWAGEAALLFWIGRTKNIQFYELLAYALILLTLISLVQDWTTAYNAYSATRPEARIRPLFNINFFTSLMVMGAFGFINLLYFNRRYPNPINSNLEIRQIFSVFIPAIFIIVLYFPFRIEIATYWNQLFVDSMKIVKRTDPAFSDFIYNVDLLKFRRVWIINYSLLFVLALSVLNITKIRNSKLGLLSLTLGTIAILAFLIQSLNVMGELRGSFLNQLLTDPYPRSHFYLWLRYVSYPFAGLVLIFLYRTHKQDFMYSDTMNLGVLFDCLLHLTILWIAGSELITWMDILKFSQSHQLGLSILWGVYALFVIVLGIWKKKKYLRIGAIALFGVTLYKLFFFDISDLDTIAKTIVFVSLGLLLLIISFLYNKYKHMISD
jgi:uncharacterized membrane protein